MRSHFNRFFLFTKTSPRPRRWPRETTQISCMTSKKQTFFGGLMDPARLQGGDARFSAHHGDISTKPQHSHGPTKSWGEPQDHRRGRHTQRGPQRHIPRWRPQPCRGSHRSHMTTNTHPRVAHLTQQSFYRRENARGGGRFFFENGFFGASDLRAPMSRNWVNWRIFGPFFVFEFDRFFVKIINKITTFWIMRELIHRPPRRALQLEASWSWNCSLFHSEATRKSKFPEEK